MLVSNKVETFEQEIRGVMLSGGIMLFARVTFDGTTYTLERPQMIQPERGPRGEPMSKFTDAVMSKDPTKLNLSIDKSHVVFTYELHPEMEVMYADATGMIVKATPTIQLSR
jgi:hypothetical protein